MHKTLLKSNIRRLSLESVVSTRLAAIEKAGTMKHERIISSSQGPHISVESSAQNVINFCANNYLGLAGHPEIINAAVSALKSHGAGLSSVRFICGTQDIHIQLENKIAQFHGREDAILYPSCFDANAGVFEALLGPEDAVISDELNHASIIDGIRLCKAKRLRYLHRDMNDLSAKLDSVNDARIKLVVTDGVFSMDGNVAPLKEIISIAKSKNAYTFIDECHATGFFGKTGRGTEEYTGVMNQVDIINSTLGKAMGGAAGGYTTASAAIVKLLRQISRPYLFSNSLPPPVVGSALKAFDLIMSSDEFFSQLLANTKLFRNEMTEAGFLVLGDKEHPICPVMMPDEFTAIEFSNLMLKKGIYVVGFTYPVVPMGKPRIRVQISAAHTINDVKQAIDAFVRVGRELKVVN